MRLPIKIRALIHVLIQHTSIILLGLYFGNVVQMIIIDVLFFIFRRKYEKSFHATTFIRCTICSILSFLVVSSIAEDFKSIMISSIFITYIITEIAYRVQDYLDLQKLAKKLNERKDKTNRQRILELVENDEDKIEELCKKYALINISETVYLYLNNTVEEVSAMLNIEIRTVYRRIKKFLKAIEK